MTKTNRRKFFKYLIGLLSIPTIYIWDSAAEATKKSSVKRSVKIHLKVIEQGLNYFDDVIVNKSGGNLLVFSNKCTHLGCTVKNKGEKIVCPCHGSEYDLNGAALKGPAANPLKKLPYTIDNDSITIEIS